MTDILEQLKVDLEKKTGRPIGEERTFYVPVKDAMELNKRIEDTIKENQVDFYLSARKSSRYTCD